MALRRDSERRHVRCGELDTWLTFYPQDDPGPLAGCFGVLEMLNEMRLPPGEGTAPGPRDEAEIVTYVREGALSQESSTGTSGVLCAGEFQHMITGIRIRRKETNASPIEEARVFLIFLRPSEVGLDPACEQRHFTVAQRRNVLCVVGSPDGRKGSLRVHQDAIIYSSILEPGHHLIHELLPGRCAWLHVVDGQVKLSEFILTRGDGVGLTLEPSLSLTAQEHAEVLLVELGARYT